MRLIDPKQSQPQLATGFFIGTVHSQPLVTEEVSKGLRVGLVQFSAGARTPWHTHTHEQVLLVTEGRGILQGEQERFEVTPGMMVYVPPGERHWHGATEDSAFTHYSITTAPGETKVVEE